MVRWVVGSILHGVKPLSFFSFHPALHDWCNKGRGMYYPVCGMMHIKLPLLLIGKSSLCGGSGFPLSLSEREIDYYYYNERQMLIHSQKIEAQKIAYVRIVQIYPEFRIFYLPSFFSIGYGHRHISGSLNFIKTIFRIFFFFFVRPFSSMKERYGKTHTHREHETSRTEKYTSYNTHARTYTHAHKHTYQFTYTNTHSHTHINAYTHADIGLHKYT